MPLDTLRKDCPAGTFPTQTLAFQCKKLFQGETSYETIDRSRRPLRVGRGCHCNPGIRRFRAIRPGGAGRQPNARSVATVAV